ncbi:hypothetical protein ACHWQZ_G010278 [Mnemiopsis leidyi]
METEVQDLEGAQKLFWDVLYNTDWTEWWLVSLQTFHVLMFCFVVITHRANWHFLSAIIFLFLLTLMYFAQTINTLAAQNYNQFTNEQYFDSDGLFITIILLLPCALNCILFIFSWLLQSWNLMVDLKRQQAKRYAASQKKDK